MKDIRSCSNVSLRRKRKYIEGESKKSSNLINRHNNESIVSKPKRRSISLSNTYFSVNSFSIYDSLNFMNNNGTKGVENGKVKKKEKIDDNDELRQYKNNDIQNNSSTESRINKKDLKSSAKYLEGIKINKLLFKKILFKKAFFYKMRCLNHNSAWLLELSKGKKEIQEIYGKKRGGNKIKFYSKSKKNDAKMKCFRKQIKREASINDLILMKPFPFYRKFTTLFYQKKYKEAYLMLIKISSYCVFFSLKERDILNENYFKNNYYNLYYLVNLTNEFQNFQMCSKGSAESKENCSIPRKNIKYGSYSYLFDKNKNKTDQTTLVFHVLPKKKNNNRRENFINRDKIGAYNFNIKVEEEKYNFFVNYKFYRYENGVNNLGKVILKQDSFLPHQVRKIIKVDKMDNTNNKISYEDIKNDRSMGKMINKENEIDDMKYNFDKDTSKALIKNNTSYDNETDKLMNESKEKSIPFFKENNYYYNKFKTRMRVDARLILFLKMLCLYMYGNSFGTTRKSNEINNYYGREVLKRMGRQTTKESSNNMKCDYYSSNWSNDKRRIKEAARKEVLKYMIIYLKKVKKEIKFDTYLYLLLSIIYRDLRMYKKCVFYARKSIEKDYFNFVSWTYFNNIVSIEIIIQENMEKEREIKLGTKKKIAEKRKAKKANNKNFNMKREKKNKRTIKNVDILKGRKKLIKKNINFLENSDKIKRMCDYLFGNEFFSLYEKPNMEIIMTNYNDYIYINPFININKSFFFNNNYFVSKIFTDLDDKEGSLIGKRNIDKNQSTSKKKIDNKIDINKNYLRRNKMEKLSNVYFLQKYEIYKKRYNFKNSIMTLFGFAHFCSLNSTLHKYSIYSYEYLRKRLGNNLYVLSELGKLYYYNGKINKSMKCFRRVKKVCNENKKIKTKFTEKCFVLYLEEKRRKQKPLSGSEYNEIGQGHDLENEIDYKEDDFNGDYDTDANCDIRKRNTIEVITPEIYKIIKKMWIPNYFTNMFIYMELLVNIYYLKKDTSKLFLILNKYENSKKKNKCLYISRKKNEKMIKNKIWDDKFYYSLGKYYSLIKNCQMAIYYFKKSIKKNNFHLYSYLCLAKEYFSCGNLNSSIFILIKLISLYMNNSNAWFCLGKCLECKNNYDLSIFSYKNAIYFRKDTVFYYFLANIYFKTGQINNCIGTLKSAWRHNKNLLFSSMLFDIYLKKEKRNFFLQNEDRTLEEHWEINDKCHAWCVRFLKDYFKNLRRKCCVAQPFCENKREQYNFYEALLSLFNLNKPSIKHLQSVNFLSYFNKYYEKNSSYFYLIRSLKHSSLILYDGIYYLANYFLFNKQIKKALILFKILWDAEGPYSKESFHSFKYMQCLLQRNV
ncbi:tetratricopeptide repeat protein, putative [Plasmodium chabaudi chabaudi]|uniref:Tetratricopeptide repeat protein, putative n=1 Tax=Plasmodium chabaudi chabaudi TaxID=31271 RepID=A0A4V0K1M0_PLACU|nr:tetratricopeptide repeat protein, putative [Plasmodium chabaudi chabaudi]VTZ66731.1 tetratricopeptide repeat protein, putative [Plasmodium chabaudi chabaudi]|eukprot:XP_732335.2 conserved Plasmodium protein, unknown function [Plasmodium chabaudi chabaudi]